jgi:hypothetical protein
VFPSPETLPVTPLETKNLTLEEKANAAILVGFNGSLRILLPEESEICPRRGPEAK